MTYIPTAPESGNSFRHYARYLTKPIVRLAAGLAAVGVGVYTGIPLLLAAGGYLVGDGLASKDNQGQAMFRRQHNQAIQFPERKRPFSSFMLLIGAGSALITAGLIRGGMTEVAAGGLAIGEAVRSQFGGGYDRSKLPPPPAPH